MDGFRAAIGEVMEVAGARRCVVWANIVRPPYRHVSYRGYNRVLAREAERRDNLRVVNWVRMVRNHRAWLPPTASTCRRRATGRARGPSRRPSAPASEHPPRSSGQLSEGSAGMVAISL